MTRKEWYSKPGNKERVMEYSRKRRLRNQKFLAEHKSKRGCVICGENHPGCLDFHHRDPEKKTKSLSALACCKASIKTLEAEMKKCDILCANCHRKKNWEDFNVAVLMDIA